MLAKSFSAAIIACIGVAIKLEGAPPMKAAQVEGAPPMKAAQVDTESEAAQTGSSLAEQMITTPSPDMDCSDPAYEMLCAMYGM